MINLGDLYFKSFLLFLIGKSSLVKIKLKIQIYKIKYKNLWVINSLSFLQYKIKITLKIINNLLILLFYFKNKLRNKIKFSYLGEERTPFLKVKEVLKSYFL